VTLSLEVYTNSIQEHSEALARLAPRAMDLPIAHCPGWSVEDLLRHLTEVHWFWATIVEQRLDTRPEEGRPVDLPRSELIARFLLGAHHLVDVLRSANQSEHVWTWAPSQQNVAFVTRHQVQEIAVHHWDVAHALGKDLVIAGDVAADAIDEFLTFSVSSASDPAEPSRPSLDGSLSLLCTDLDEGWTVRDASVPGTVEFSVGTESGVPTLSASSSDLLLWLYSRVPVSGDAEANALGGRFHALCFTD